MLKKKVIVLSALEKDIADGTIAPGEMIPSRAQLMRRFHCSRSVVERAVADLTARGILTGKQGKGTFVSVAHETENIPIRKIYAVSSYYVRSFNQKITCLLLDSNDLGLPVEFIPSDRADAECETLCQSDALVLFINPDYEQLPLMHYLKSRHIPLLLINREFDGFNRICTDCLSGFRAGLAVLDNIPGAPLAVIGRECMIKYPYQASRLVNFFRACAENGIRIPEENFLISQFDDPDEEIREAERLFSDRPARIAVLNSDLTEPLVNFAVSKDLQPGKDFHLLAFEYRDPLADTPGIIMIRQRYDAFYDELKRFIPEYSKHYSGDFQLFVEPEIIVNQHQIDRGAEMRESMPDKPC